MKKAILNLIVALSLVLFSCNDNYNIQLTKNWKVIKVEKIVKVMPNSYTYVDIGVTPIMSYYFIPNNKIEITTKYGGNLTGNWYRTDSLITINIKEETKKFKIITLTDKILVMTSDKYKFHFEKK